VDPLGGTMAAGTMSPFAGGLPPPTTAVPTQVAAPPVQPAAQALAPTPAAAPMATQPSVEKPKKTMLFVAIALVVAVIVGVVIMKMTAH
jgi:hypothetical protein